jgi:hypothetical protein
MTTGMTTGMTTRIDDIRMVIGTSASYLFPVQLLPPPSM